jgi:tRNA threonylcarbamoyladenosine biosynthesis protein TsaB
VLILAFDTSGAAGSLAVLKGGLVLAEAQLDRARRSAQTIAPAICDILAKTGIEPGDIRLVATTVGPGSFTGLRIGVTAAKTFAYAVKADCLGLSTLEVIAAAVPEGLVGERREVNTVLDAQRGEVFVGRFQLTRSADQGDLPLVERLAEDGLQSAASWLEGLPPQAIVTGAGLRKLKDAPITAQTLDETYWEPRAAVLGRLAWRYYQAGRRDDLWKLAPVYLRPSYAEEKAARV